MFLTWIEKGAVSLLIQPRGRGKGRVAVASLLLAVVLLVTAGSLNLFLGTTVKMAGNVAPYDVRVQVYNGWSMMIPSRARCSRPSPPCTRSCATRRVLEGVGSSINLSLPVSIPAALVGEQAGANLDNAVVAADGTVEKQVSLALVDDASYHAYLEQQGLDPQVFMDPEYPVAVANRHVCGNDGLTYKIMDMFVDNRSIQMYAYEDRTGALALPWGIWVWPCWWWRWSPWQAPPTACIAAALTT